MNPSVSFARDARHPKRTAFHVSLHRN
jgi:hypothetical protein